MKRLWAGIAAAMAIASGAHAATPVKPLYVFTTVDVPAAGATQARAIHNAGEIVGTYGATNASLRAEEPLHGFRLSKGTFATIDHPGTDWTFPEAITESGKIAGFYGAYDQRGYAYTPIVGYVQDGDTFTDFANRGLNTWVLDAADHGPIIGFSHDSGGVGPAYVYEDGTFDEYNYPGTQTTYFTGITETGVTLGVGGGLGPFLLRHGSVEAITYPTGVSGASVTDVNNRGDVAGSFFSSTGIHGYVMRHDMLTQLDVPGADATEVFGINDRGDVVGQYHLNGIVHGFLGRRL